MIYFFQTEKATHRVPRDILISAMKLTPEGKSFDECYNNRRTKVFKYVRDWALRADEVLNAKKKN